MNASKSGKYEAGSIPHVPKQSAAAKPKKGKKPKTTKRPKGGKGTGG